MLAAPELLCIAEMYVRPFEVAVKDPDQVVPVMDLSRQQVLEPSSGRVSQEQREVVDDDPIVLHPA